MAVGKERTRNHVKGFQKEIGSLKDAPDDRFSNWFAETGADLAGSFLHGEIDLSLHVLNNLVGWRDPSTLDALEIGHGGGRLLAAAARHFRSATGVDIHDQNARVEKLLKSRGVKSFTLIRSDGKSLPVPDSSKDIVYSMIVLQHVERIEVLNAYLSEAYRVLKPGGRAVLYCGRLGPLSTYRESPLLLRLESALTRLWLPGYLETTAMVNAINLRLAPWYFRRLARKTGFTILASQFSRRFPRWEKFGNQYGLVLEKPVLQKHS